MSADSLVGSAVLVKVHVTLSPSPRSTEPLVPLSVNGKGVAVPVTTHASEVVNCARSPVLFASLKSYVPTSPSTVMKTVPVQPERESGRSALVLDAALRAGIFKALGSFDPMGFWDGHGS